MKVLFADFGADIASSRLRAKIPQQELAKMGVEKGNDVLIYGKHFIADNQVCGFKKLIFDVCDDHFNHPELGDYYRRHVAMADTVTCNSEVMRRRIKTETGREAVVIREPYESPEREAKIGPSLFWYGHKSNLQDLERVAPHLHHPLLVMSNTASHATWTQQAFDSAIQEPCIVIIPTGKSQAKSENRMVESIRNGRYVCAEHLPAYEPFDCFFPLGDIPEHIEIVLDDPDYALGQIRAAQGYIRDRYSPRTIAEQWLEVIKCL